MSDVRKVYGDAAYGTGEFQQDLNDHGIWSGCRTQRPAPRPGGLFNKDLFIIDFNEDTVCCPAGELAGECPGFCVRGTRKGAAEPGPEGVRCGDPSRVVG